MRRSDVFETSLQVLDRDTWECGTSQCMYSLSGFQDPEASFNLSNACEQWLNGAASVAGSLGSGGRPSYVLLKTNSTPSVTCIHMCMCVSVGE